VLVPGTAWQSWASSIERLDRSLLVVEIMDTGCQPLRVLQLPRFNTRTSPRTIAYEATIEDPQVFTMPWKIHWTLRQQSGAELIEDECEVDSKDVRHHVLPFKT
jgi:hypothetical protein